MLKEFREFLLRGNVMDLAVAVIIGGAFSAIVNSLVKDIVMPLIGILIGGVDFTTLAVQVGSASVTYGNFIQAIINFVVIGLVIFLMVKSLKAMEERFSKKVEAKEEPKPPAEDIVLLSEIRDLLKQQR